MEGIEQLLTILGADIIIDKDKNYKGFKLTNSVPYFKELNRLTGNFKITLAKYSGEQDFFILSNRISSIQFRLMSYYQRNCLDSYPDELEKAEIKKIYILQEIEENKKSGLFSLKKVLEKEIEICRNITQYLFQVYNELESKKLSKNQPVADSPLLEKVRFEGELTVLVGTFLALYKSKKISFNKEFRYTSEEKHFADFIQKNFLFKKGKEYSAITAAAKALADIRNYHENTADVTKGKVLTLLSDSINYLTNLKEELDNNTLRHKKSED
ncbi:MAG: hypothetical protein IPN99_12680 [Bacteroidetes bacterium]|nr:hypothetical protein [Bacteroidota bacterium]